MTKLKEGTIDLDRMISLIASHASRYGLAWNIQNVLNFAMGGVSNFLQLFNMKVMPVFKAGQLQYVLFSANLKSGRFIK